MEKENTCYHNPSSSPQTLLPPPVEEKENTFPNTRGADSFQKKKTSLKVAPADDDHPATAGLDEMIHVETHLRGNFFEKHGIGINAGGGDVRKTIKYTHMREASKKGFFEWFVLRPRAPLIVTNKPLPMY